VPTEKEIEAEAKKQCLRAFEPYTYGPYFDALRDECRRMARETLEARECAKEYAWPAPGSEDTELGVFMGPEVGHGETKVYTGVQA
jgi:hypothetical protein